MLEQSAPVAETTQTVTPLPSQVKSGRTLAQLKPGERALVACVTGNDSLKRRLSALGVIRGAEIVVDKAAPLGDPRVYRLMGYMLSLRNQEAAQVQLQ
ncbi:hypothetical protein JCM17960_03790 [Magnetospira thiophila]